MGERDDVVATATALDGSASRIAAYDAAGGGAPLRALSSGPADSSPGVSPDGAQVAFTRGFDTWVVPLAGGPERLLARGVVDASWGGPLPGRPQLVPGSLRARGRRRDAVAIARSGPRGLRASLVGAAPLRGSFACGTRAGRP